MRNEGRKGRGRWEGASPCRVTRVFQKGYECIRLETGSLSFLPVVLVVSCKSLVSRNTWNSCVGRAHCPEKPCNHLLLFHPRRVQLSPFSIENPLRFFPLRFFASIYLCTHPSKQLFWKLIFMELVKNITRNTRFTNYIPVSHCGYYRYLRRIAFSSFTMDPGWFRNRDFYLVNRNIATFGCKIRLVRV